MAEYGGLRYLSCCGDSGLQGDCETACALWILLCYGDVAGIDGGTEVERAVRLVTAVAVADALRVCRVAVLGCLCAAEAIVVAVHAHRPVFVVVVILHNGAKA